MSHSIYLASPFFNDTELECVKQAEQILRGRGLKVFSPRTIDVNKETLSDAEWAAQTFQIDQTAIENSEIVVALYHGMYSDSGTAWEIGYAYGLRKKVIVVCVNPLDEQSLMPINGATMVLGSIESLGEFDFDGLFVDELDTSNYEIYVPEIQM